MRSKKIDRGWRDWYQLQRWRNRSKSQLRTSPLCAFCLARGVAMPATIADHVISHRGDWNAFWTGKLQSLCVICHNGDKQAGRGYRRDVGDDGWPVDPKHPANRR